MVREFAGFLFNNVRAPPYGRPNDRLACRDVASDLDTTLTLNEFLYALHHIERHGGWGLN